MKKIIMVVVGITVLLLSYIYLISDSGTYNTEGCPSIEQASPKENPIKTVEASPKKTKQDKKESKAIVDPIPKAASRNMSDEMIEIDDELRSIRKSVSKDLEEANIRRQNLTQGEDLLNQDIAQVEEMISKVNEKLGIDGEAIKQEIIAKYEAPLDDGAPAEIKKEIDKADEIMMNIEQSLSELETEQ